MQPEDVAHIRAVLPLVPVEAVERELKLHAFDNNRVDVVINILLDTGPTIPAEDENRKRTHSPSEDGPKPKHSATATVTTAQKTVAGPSRMDVASEEPVAGPSGVAQTVVDPLTERVQAMLDIIPDCDEHWMRKKVSLLLERNGNLEQFVDDLLQGNVKYEKYVKKTSPNMPSKAKPRDPEAINNYNELTADDFLEMFEDPIAHFSNIPVQKTYGFVNDCNYDAWMGWYVLQHFPRLYANDFNKFRRLHRGNVIACVRAVKAARDGGTLAQRKVLRTQRENQMPGCPAPKSFCLHSAFLRLEPEILEKRDAPRKLREAEFAAAKATGSLLECGICCNDELLLVDMLQCADGLHLFCKECVTAHVRAKMGEGKLEFACLDSECTGSYLVETLQPLLRPAEFSKLLLRLNSQAVASADIPNLVQCPFCEFATIMDNPEDKIFRCLAPDCNRESCRLCKEPSHIPLRCDELEKSEEVKLRTAVEEKMSEALMRTCWKCSKKFLKEEGCNKMTCPCGASMCYLCRQPVKDYDHFSENDPKKCPLWMESEVVHAKEVQNAAKSAKAELEAARPGFQFKHDPTAALPMASAEAIKREKKKREAILNWERRFQEMERLYQQRGDPNVAARLERMLAERNQEGANYDD